jgi:two-component system sensor histidine kinase KdpD
MPTRVGPRRAPAGVTGPFAVTFVPLTAGEQTVGMLRLAAPRGRPPWTPEEARLLDAASEQIGRAIERDRLRRAATEAEVLRKTEEVRQAVLAAVSHDLRTPLASIRASAESLDQADVEWTEDERRGFLAAIRQESEHLNRLVENLLDMSRIEAGRLKPDRGWYPLEELVEDVLARLEPATAGHRVVVDLPETLPPVPLDYVQIGQVLSNLVENAAKYTPPGSTIAVSAAREDGFVRVAVADDGPGIPPDALPHVFEKFYRVTSGDRSPVKGTGIGLALARGFVEAHGGTIEAQSPPPGKQHGTVFSFRLPLAAPEGATAT